MAVALARRVGKDLTEHESRFRAAFYQANVGMLKLDTEGKVIEANQAMADILDHRRDVLLQLSLGDLLMDGELVIDGVGRIDWDRQLRPSELRFRRRDGSLVWGAGAAPACAAPAAACRCSPSSKMSARTMHWRARSSTTPATIR
jgi:PAS domain S-box-containing protein